MDSFWVDGVPTSFSSSPVKDEWRRRLRQRAGQEPAPAADANGLAFSFVLPPTKRNVDVDNLCDPVLEVLVGRHKEFGGILWFGGSRPNLRWLFSSKRYGAPTGCSIYAGPAPPQATIDLFREPILNGQYTGRLPAKVRGDPAHDMFAAWAVENAEESERKAEVAVRLRFSGLATNLGDFASGGIKALLDGLSGVLGSERWTDVDHRVVALLAEKGVESSPGVAVTVSRSV